MYNREINRLVKHLKDLVDGSSFEEAMVISNVVEEISIAIKKENPKFNRDEFYYRIFPAELSQKIAMHAISRMAQQLEHQDVTEQNDDTK